MLLHASTDICMNSVTLTEGVPRKSSFLFVWTSTRIAVFDLFYSFRFKELSLTQVPWFERWRTMCLRLYSWPYFSFLNFQGYGIDVQDTVLQKCYLQFPRDFHTRRKILYFFDMTEPGKLTSNTSFATWYDNVVQYCSTLSVSYHLEKHITFTSHRNTL